MPFPSGGCRTCKIRRIKVSYAAFRSYVANLIAQCDETQPKCQKCIKSRRVCHGMGSGQTGSVLLMENVYASGQKKRPRGPRHVRSTEPESEPTNVLYRPLIDLKTKALLYYLSDHIQTVKGLPAISGGIADHFMPIWRLKADCSILNLAVSMMSLSVFAQTQQHKEAAFEASMNYQRLLRVAQVTNPSVAEGNIEACMLATFFMSRYEGVVYRSEHHDRRTPMAMNLNSFSHDDGSKAILKLWREQSNPRQPVSNVVKHVRRGVIRSALVRNHAIPDWMSDGTAFGEDGLELEYDHIIVRTANVRWLLANVLQEKIGWQSRSSELTKTLTELEIETRSIGKAIRDWSDCLPKSWRFEKRTLSEPHPWPVRDFYSPTIYMFASLAYSAVWTQYFSHRMLVLSTLLRILDLLHPMSDESAHDQRLKCASELKEMCDSLAFSVPYSLKRVRIDSESKSVQEQRVVVDTLEEIKPYLATLIAWPLSLGSMLGNLDVQQKAWFASELARLGRVLGVGMFESAEKKQWIEL